jgi:hypothetical protein
MGRQILDRRLAVAGGVIVLRRSMDQSYFGIK